MLTISIVILVIWRRFLEKYLVSISADSHDFDSHRFGGDFGTFTLMLTISIAILVIWRRFLEKYLVSISADSQSSFFSCVECISPILVFSINHLCLAVWNAFPLFSFFSITKHDF